LGKSPKMLIKTLTPMHRFNLLTLKRRYAVLGNELLLVDHLGGDDHLKPKVQLEFWTKQKTRSSNIGQKQKKPRSSNFGQNKKREARILDKTKNAMLEYWTKKTRTSNFGQNNKTPCSNFGQKQKNVLLKFWTQMFNNRNLRLVLLKKN
jgi:hypothetical protein